jgi:hypothetical protein
MFDFRGEPAGYPVHIEGETSLSPLLPEPTAEELTDRDRALAFLRAPGIMEELLGTAQDWANALQSARVPENFEVDHGPEI